MCLTWSWDLSFVIFVRIVFRFLTDVRIVHVIWPNCCKRHSVHFVEDTVCVGVSVTDLRGTFFQVTGLYHHVDSLA